MKKGLVFWFTGLSGSGKTTIAEAVKPVLEEEGYSVLILDGDDVRERLHVNLDFSPEDIKKNNSLIVQLCSQYRADYDVVLVPVISPYRVSRAEARRLLGEGFYEIYFAADLETVMRRDVKGLYAKAINNEITNMIGFSPSNIYESPQYPDLLINTGKECISKSEELFLKFVTIKLGINKK
ncbi:MAG: adenylyl-sulfate kinase [Deltaproteobacteria bacterium]|nr:adenylyl-sulfate kinase [Deltaproteobacteria bacterium]